jgi:nicotinamide-nucleotide amidase
MILIEEIGKILVSRGAKISTAESCTAGYISKILTSIPGSSNYFEGSLIVYSNKAKINVLGVEKELIDTYTEVSDLVACRMAERVKEVMGTEYSIATTGYADIEGYGTEENPPGTIYIAISTPFETLSQRIELTDSRDRNVYVASMEALEMLKESIKNHLVESL